MLKTIFKALLSSKLVAALGFLSVILGAISDPQWSTFIPSNVAGWAVTIGGPIAWLGRQLVDVNGNGIPDIFDAFLDKFGERGTATLQLLVILTLLGGLVCLLRVTARHIQVAPTVSSAVEGLTPPLAVPERWVATTPTGWRRAGAGLPPAMEHLARRQLVPVTEGA